MSIAYPEECGRVTGSRAIGDIKAAMDTLHRGAGGGRGNWWSRLRAAVLDTSSVISARRMTASAPREIDAPVENVARRARTREMGLLSLAALTFATVRDAQASDANVAILDEDSISYKDLAHGSFELVTKEAIPRHLVVEDPGETIVLTRSGSTISVNQSANSAARMEELQAAQQEAYANLAKGLGPGGSGAMPFSDTLPVQPIDFTLPAEIAPLNALPPLPAVETRAEFIILPANVPPPVPAPAVLTLALGSGPTETDTVVFDTFAATSGTFQASSSASGATLTYGLIGGVSGNTVLDGVAYDVSQTQDFGTLYLNSATGAYTFVPDDAAINALKAPTTEDFVVTVSDGTMSASQTFTIDIDGVNDEAIVAGSSTGSVSEQAGAAGTARFAAAHAQAPRIATGTLTSTDVDDAANAFTAVGSPTKSDGGYGTFTMTADGVWTYTLDDGNPAVQALNVGDRLTDTFTVTTVDGTEQVVTIVIGGRNDPAIISGDTTGSVVEAACKDPGTPTATGTLVSTDVDNPSGSFTPVTCRQSDHGYGTFSMTADGVWTYTLDNDNCTVQSLGDCDSLTDTFTVTAEDGTEQVITITIQGADDDRHHPHVDHLSTGKAASSSSANEEAAPSQVVPSQAIPSQVIPIDAAKGEEPASTAADDSQPMVASHEARSDEAHTHAAIETGLAVASGFADSFHFREIDACSPPLQGNPDCIHALVAAFVSAPTAPDIVEAIQAFHSCLSQQGFDGVDAMPEVRPLVGLMPHDLVV